MLTYVFLLALLVVATAFDFWFLRIPNWISLCLILLFVLPAISAADPAGLGWHLVALIIALAGGYPLFMFGILGGGDVKLFAATALWAGVHLLLSHLALIALLGLVLLAVLLPLRFVFWLAIRKWGSRLDLPLALVRGQGIPYGIAIAGSAAILTELMPQQFWLT